MICWVTSGNINENTLCIPTPRPSHPDIILLRWSMTISTGHYFVLPPAFPHNEESCAIHERPQDVPGIGSCSRAGMRYSNVGQRAGEKDSTATTLETLVLRVLSKLKNCPVMLSHSDKPILPWDVYE